MKILEHDRLRLRATRILNRDGLRAVLILFLFLLHFRALQDQLIGTRDTLQTAFDGLHIGIALFSVDLQVVLLNQQFQQLLDIPDSSNPIGMPCAFLKFKNRFINLKALCEESIAELQDKTIEAELIIDNNKFAILLFDASLVKSKFNNFSRIVWIISVSKICFSIRLNIAEVSEIV